MDAQQQHQHQQQPNEDGGSGKKRVLSRQSSTRWTPTTDQIQILKELYYNNGVRSPSADQIQRISAHLREYAMLVVGQMESCGWCGSATMEKSIRACSISAGGSTSINVGAAAHNFEGVGVDSYSSPYSALFKGRKQIDLENGEEEVEENQEEVETPKLETLPLFPLHGENINGLCNMKFPATSDGFHTS